MKKSKQLNSMAQIFFWCICLFSAIYIGYVLTATKQEPSYNHVDCQLLSNGWYYRGEDGQAIQLEIPVTGSVLKKEEYTIYRTLPATITEDTNLVNWVMYADAVCLVGGLERAVYNDQEYRLFGKASLSGYFEISLGPEDAGKEIAITYTTPYSMVKGYVGKFYYGTELAIRDAIVNEKLPVFVSAMLLLFIGIIVTTIGVFAKVMSGGKLSAGFGYFGMATLCYAMDPLYASGVTRYLWGSTFTWHFIYRMASFLLPLPLLFFFDSMNEGRQHKVFRFAIFANLLIMVGSIFLQFADIADFVTTQTVKNVGVAICFIAIVYSCVWEFTKGDKQTAKLILLPVVTIILSFVSVVVQTYLLKGLNTFTLMYPGAIITFVFIAYAAINTMVRRTQDAIWASKAKSDFLANMSHEIRTPINAVLGMDEMILRESSEENIVEYAENIKRAGETLLLLISDILDFSKIESGKMEIVPVEYEVAPLLDKILRVMAPQAEAKALKIKSEISPTLPNLLYGDEIRMSQIITNLLSNAVKYTEKGEVILRVSGVQKEDDIDITVMVEDTGIGIREIDIERMFDSFRRVDEKKNRNIQGSGLGLTITSQLLELMDSKLLVESVYGEGSKFMFTVRQKVAGKEEIGDFEQLLHKYRGHKKYIPSFIAPEARVLVVDDSSVNLVVFKGLLSKTKIQIDTAASGQECLALCRLHEYDVIFMDHLMPYMDGIETVSNLRKVKDGPNRFVPIIALTANAVSGSRELYMESGFQDYMTKPVVTEKLESILEKYIAKEKVLPYEE